MKRFTLLIHVLCALSAFAGEASPVARLSSMSRAEDPVLYKRIRDEIVDEFRDKPDELWRIANQEQENWRIRLAAGVCIERILRGDEIDGLDHRDWRTDPEYSPDWDAGRMANGTSRSFTPVFYRRLEDAGLWFHYLEFCDTRIDMEEMDPTFRLVPIFVRNESTGGIRHLAASIADEKVRAAFEQNSSPDTIDSNMLQEFINDGTFPQGARAFLQYSRPGFSPAPHKWQAWLPLVDDVEFLKETRSRFTTNSFEYRQINQRLAQIENEHHTNDFDPQLIDLRPFLPVLPQPDSKEDSKTKLDNREESANAERSPRGLCSFLLLACIVIGLTSVLVSVLRKSNQGRSRRDPASKHYSS